VLLASVLCCVLVPIALRDQSCAGACQDTSNSCPNQYVAGECPGPTNIQCCPEPTPDCTGQCQDNSLPCSGSYVANQCPGPANVECCSSSPPPPPGGDCSAFADSQWNCADPSCGSTVGSGQPQPNYECAEFVARSLASAGYISLGATDPQSSYANYQYNGNTYDLLWTSSHSAEGGPLGVEDLLQALGWTTGGGVGDCTVLLVEGSGGYETHVAVGVADNLIDAHNNARFHVSGSFYQVDNIYNPPALNRTANPHPRNHPKPTHYKSLYKPSN